MHDHCCVHLKCLEHCLGSDDAIGSHGEYYCELFDDDWRCAIKIITPGINDRPGVMPSTLYVSFSFNVPGTERDSVSPPSH